MTARLFTPLALRDVTIPNRIVVAPMCQYSAVEGTVGDWHLMHLGHLALAGPGLLIIEATGVESQGRITPDCTGLYSDENEAAFARIIAYCRSISDTRIGIQLNHAGRKGSTMAPWLGGGPLATDKGAWVPDAPSPVPYLPDWAPPAELDHAGLARIRDAFVQATRRASRLGLDLIELHVAHGYLLHQFLSPLTNTRTDEYGGDLEGRMRFPLDVFDAVRAAFPVDRPVTVRLSATDWIDGGWDMAQSLIFIEALKDRSCDLIDVTSGGLRQDQSIQVGPGYQTRFAAEIRQKIGIPVMAVGQITHAVQAETIVSTDQADCVALARGMLWDPRWVWKAALELGAEIALPPPYARCNPALRAKPFVKR